MKSKTRKKKLQGLLRIPLPFEETIADVLKVKPQRKRKLVKGGKKR